VSAGLVWNVARSSRRRAAVTRRGGCAAALVLVLSACEAPPEEKGCQHAEVQTLAKKLLVMQIDEAMKPKTDSEARLEALAKSGRNSDTEALLNSIRSKGVDAGRVSFSEVSELKGPKADGPQKPASSPAGALAQMMGLDDDALYVCSAKASMQLPAPAVERLKVPLKGSGMLDEASGQFTPRIVYTTRLDKDRRLEIGMRFENWMLGLMLKSSLRGVAEDLQPR
jgi:hypothetical protein